jgi:hypothetical protein
MMEESVSVAHWDSYQLPLVVYIMHPLHRLAERQDALQKKGICAASLASFIPISPKSPR